jgi:hypothetical protein
VFQDVLEASLLACSQCAVVHMGRSRVRAQWSYLYGEEYLLRARQLSRQFCPALVPAGCGAFQAETYFSNKYKPMTATAEDWIDPTIEGLLKCGLGA